MPNPKKIKIAIIGGSGFMGLNLINHISKNKNIGIINICSSKPISLKKLVNKILLKKDKLKFINFDSKINNDYESKCFWGNNNKFNQL